MIIVSIVFFLLSILGLIALFKAGEKFDSLSFIKKIDIRSAIILPLVFIMIYSGVHFLPIISFVLFLIGDIAAMKDVKYAIPIFAISHILMSIFLFSVVSFVGSPFIMLVLFVAVILKMAENLFKIKDKKIKIFSFVYLSIILIPTSILLICNASTLGILLMFVGYIYFILSDIMLAEHSFVEPIKYIFVRNSIYYYLAIFLIFFGLMVGI